MISVMVPMPSVGKERIFMGRAKTVTAIGERMRAIKMG